MITHLQYFEICTAFDPILSTYRSMNVKENSNDFA